MYIYVCVCVSVCVYIYVCVCLCVCIYIHIYIFTNLLSTSIHGYQKKRKKTPPGTRDKNISNHHPGEKEKISLDKKKEKANPVIPVEKNMQSVGQKKNKTHRQRCNATITRVLNTSGAN